MACPVCGSNQSFYKCDTCGDVRCASNKCKKPTPVGKSSCVACKKGKYVHVK